MIQNQHYIIKPSGIVKGGTAQYTLDTDKAAVEYQAEITVGFLFVTKTYKKSGTYALLPKDLLSENLRTPGRVIMIQNVRFTVLKVDTLNRSVVAVEVLGERMSGTATFGTAKQYAELFSLNAKATVSGVNVNLALTEVG